MDRIKREKSVKASGVEGPCEAEPLSGSLRNFASGLGKKIEKFTVQ
jgi:hypothetical protein